MAALESTDVREFGEGDKEAIVRKLNGKVFHIVLVGSAGAGKSTLANTLLGRKEFQEKHSVDAITEHAAKGRIEVDLDGQGTATVVIHDTPGMTGHKKNSKLVEEELRKVDTFDLLVLCIPLDSDGGLYFPAKVNPVFEMVENVWGKGTLAKKAVIILTRSNRACEDVEEQAAKDRTAGTDPFTFEGLLEIWKKDHQEEHEGSEIANLPILIAGRIVMDEKSGKPVSISEVNKSREWLDTLLSDICKYTSPDHTAFVHAWRQKMVLTEPDVTETGNHWLPSWFKKGNCGRGFFSGH